MIDIFDFQKLENIVAVVSGVIGFLGFVLKLFRYLKKKHSSWLKSQLNEFFGERFSGIESINKKIDIIFKEVTPNSGTSIKDKINKIEKSMEQNTELTYKIFNRQRWMFDSDSEPIFETDKQGKCVWANKAYINLVEKDLKDLLDNGWKNIIHHDFKESVYNEWDSCILDGRNFDMSYKIINTSGKTYDVRCIAIKADDGGYMGSYKILEDRGKYEGFIERGYG